MKTQIGIVRHAPHVFSGLLLLTASCGVLGAPAEENHDTSASSGLSNVTSMPCAIGGGSCKAASECSLGTGSIGSSKYNCGGSRRVCCFSTCGSEAETVECCNANHTFAPRPLCQDGKLTCAAGQTKVPLGSCVAAASAR
jgi:hypothetical protein